MPIFEIKPEDINALNDEQARELVARLCKANLRAQNLSDSFITWGGDQRAADGGVDVRVAIFPPVEISGYIPKNNTIFQVKAEKFPASEIAKEMIKNGVLRPVIAELPYKNGAYIIVSTKDNTSDSELKKRKAAMEKCLEEQGLAKQIHLDFYDSRKIADWVENFPLLIVWLRQILNKPLIGWQPYAPWAYNENSLDAEYFTDDKIKVFVPNNSESKSAVSAMAQLRQTLQQTHTSVRLVGLSGVGKTRFVQALFDARVNPEITALDPENVLYTDVSNNPTPPPSVMMETLIAKGFDGVIVIDNCSAEMHRALTKIVKETDRKLKLITIEYDIRDDLPEGTDCYRLEGSSQDVIEKIIEKYYPKISIPDRHKIAEFSEGNARVALALASTGEGYSGFAQLRDDALFRRLFMQKNSESTELLRCAEVVSLLYSFDAKSTAPDSELAVLAKIGDFSIQSFLQNINELKNRGLIQQRDKWKALLPQAIANKLAANALATYLKKTLSDSLVINAPERVARSFSRRLSYLHESKDAQNIVAEWFQPTGLLGNATRLSDFQMQMFANAAPVNQGAALEALCRAVKNDAFVAVKNPQRAHFARLLRSLAYEAKQFDQAASALLRFALAEPENYKTDSTRHLLKSLFYFRLSGTHATAEQCANFVKSLSFSAAESERKVALTLLESGLQTGRFSSHYDFNFGALKRDFGRDIRTIKGEKNWYRAFINVVAELSKTKSAAYPEAKKKLGDAFYGLWINEQMEDDLLAMAREFSADEEWSEAFHAIALIRKTLVEEEYLTNEAKEKLNALKEIVQGKSLLQTIRLRIFSRGLFGYFKEDGSVSDYDEFLKRAQKEAEALGKEAALDQTVLAHFSSFFINTDTTSQTFHFGYGFAQATKSMPDLLERAKCAIAKNNTQKIDISFISGLISGWQQTKPEELEVFLAAAVNDKIFGCYFPEFQWQAGLNKAAYPRLMQSLKLQLAPSAQFNYLGLAYATGKFSIAQFSALIEDLSKRSADGLTNAIEVLHQAIYRADKDDDEEQIALQNYCAKFMTGLNWLLLDQRNSNLTYHLKEIVIFALHSESAPKMASAVLKRVIKEIAANWSSIVQLGEILSPFFEKYPQEALDSIYCSDEKQLFLTLWMLIDQSHSSRSENSAIAAVPKDALLKWCAVSPTDRTLFAAETCLLFNRVNTLDSSGNRKTETSLSETALALLEFAPDQEKILNIFVRRFSPRTWSGSRAAIMRQRLKVLDQINTQNNPDLATYIANIKTDFAQSIAKEEREEEKHERRQSSFE